MKKSLIILGILLLFTLSACKVVPSEGTEAKTAPTTEAQAWEYLYVNVRCSYDGGSNAVVCSYLDKEDSTYLENLMREKLQQGYELDEVVHTSSSAGLVQTFMFRRPYTPPPVEE